MRRILITAILLAVPSTALAQEYLLKGEITDGSTLFSVSENVQWSIPWEVYGDPSDGYPIDYVARLNSSPDASDWTFHFAAKSSLDGNQTHVATIVGDPSMIDASESLSITSIVGRSFLERFDLDLNLLEGSGSWSWSVDCPACDLAFPLPNATATVTSIDPAPTADFNDDGQWDLDDIDALMTEIATEGKNPTYDLSSDGLVDSLDRDLWLVEAAQRNGFRYSYLLGDANLDGIVNAADMGPVGVNWQNDETKWSSGNFVGAGVRSDDLTLLALNWQQRSNPLTLTVPEPSGTLMLLWLVVPMLVCRRPV